MRPLDDAEFELLCAGSGIPTVRGPDSLPVAIQLARAGLLAIYRPTLPTCGSAFEATDRGKLAMRVHLAWLGSR